MKLSIVTINLNNKSGLLKTINSVASQKMGDLIEYIVIDGLSNDGSIDVINEFKGSIDKAKIEKDNGIFNAMNKGVDLATGNYIYFLNSGDVFSDSHVLLEFFKIIDNPKDDENLIYGVVNTFVDGKYYGRAATYPWFAHQGVFLETQLMKKYKFDENFQILGDLDLFKRLHVDNKIIMREIDLVVANLELDGVGSSPEYIFKRIADKKYFSNKHNSHANFLMTYLAGYLGFFMFKAFGYKFYFYRYLRIVSLIKKFLFKMRGD